METSNTYRLVPVHSLSLDVIAAAPGAADVTELDATPRQRGRRFLVRADRATASDVADAIRAQLEPALSWGYLAVRVGWPGACVVVTYDDGVWTKHTLD